MKNCFQAVLLLDIADDVCISICHHNTKTLRWIHSFTPNSLGARQRLQCTAKL